jgi:hypothetical protein
MYRYFDTLQVLCWATLELALAIGFECRYSPHFLIILC